MFASTEANRGQRVQLEPCTHFAQLGRTPTMHFFCPCFSLVPKAFENPHTPKANSRVGRRCLRSGWMGEDSTTDYRLEANYAWGHPIPLRGIEPHSISHATLPLESAES